jgi:hypothetical protein
MDLCWNLSAGDVFQNPSFLHSTCTSNASSELILVLVVPLRCLRSDVSPRTRAVNCLPYLLRVKAARVGSQRDRSGRNRNGRSRATHDATRVQSF